MGEECRVAVGSTNRVKVNAVARAFKLLCTASVTGVAVESGVSRQPRSLEETMLGALNRAEAALRSGDYDYGVGVEAGVFQAAGMIMDVQVAAIVDSSGRVSIGYSPAFALPPRWAERVLAGEELGSVAGSNLSRRDIGRRLVGVIGYLTVGYVTRLELTEHAVIMALVPRLNPDLYGELPSLEEVRGRLKCVNP